MTDTTNKASEQTVRNILERTVARGVDASVYLAHDPKKFDSIFGQGVNEAEAAINAKIVSLLEELQFDINLKKRVYTDGLNEASMTMAVPMSDIDAAIARIKDNKATKLEKEAS